LQNTGYLGDIESIKDIAAGQYHSLAVDADGSIFAWGSNQYGQAGAENDFGATPALHTCSWYYGPSECAWYPYQLLDQPTPNRVKAVEAGFDHSLALDNGGDVWAWGRNTNGQLGDGTFTDSDVPLRLPGLSSQGQTLQMAAGGAHSIVITDEVLYRVWGKNKYGQLAHDTTPDIIPVAPNFYQEKIEIPTPAIDGFGAEFGELVAFDVPGDPFAVAGWNTYTYLSNEILLPGESRVFRVTATVPQTVVDTVLVNQAGAMYLYDPIPTDPGVPVVPAPGSFGDGLLPGGVSTWGIPGNPLCVTDNNLPNRLDPAVEPRGLQCDQVPVEIPAVTVGIEIVKEAFWRVEAEACALLEDSAAMADCFTALVPLPSGETWADNAVTDVVWRYTVTNTGGLAITDLTVTDTATLTTVEPAPPAVEPVETPDPVETTTITDVTIFKCSQHWQGCVDQGVVGTMPGGASDPLPAGASDFWWSAEPTTAPQGAGRMQLVFDLNRDFPGTPDIPLCDERVGGKGYKSCEPDGIVGFAVSAGGAYGPVTIDWGDGTVETFTGPTKLTDGTSNLSTDIFGGANPYAYTGHGEANIRTHRYNYDAKLCAIKPLNCEYIVTVTGDYRHFGFWYEDRDTADHFGGPAAKGMYAHLIGALVAVQQWDADLPFTAALAFADAVNLTDVVTPPSSISDMNGMFTDAWRFNDPRVSNWDVSNVGNMWAMFSGAVTFNQNLSRWDTHTVGAASQWCIDEAVLNGEDPDLVCWDSGFGRMFDHAYSFNNGGDPWTDNPMYCPFTHGEFLYAEHTTLCADWVANYGSLGAAQPLTWDTHSAQTMWAMFRNAEHFNADISGWDTHNVNAMGNMFQNAIGFNQPIGTWNVSHVSGDYNDWAMAYMFAGAWNFYQPLCQWDVSADPNHQWFASSAGSFEGDTWLHPNWGGAPGCAAPPAGDMQLVFDTSLDHDGLVGFGMSAGGSYGPVEVCWGDEDITGLPCDIYDAGNSWWHPFNGSTSAQSDGTCTVTDTECWGLTELREHTYADYGVSGHEYTVTITGKFEHFGVPGALVFNDAHGFDPWIESLVRVPVWNNTNTKTVLFGFLGAANLEAVTEPPHSVTDMGWMFALATHFNDPSLEHWNTKNVTDMTAMFSFATDFNVYIKSWNTSNVTSMMAMFAYAPSFNAYLGFWDVSNVANMSQMFEAAASFDGADLDKWNVSNVTNMDGMFADATSFNWKIGTWDVSKVEFMERMFSGASAFDQPLGKWNVSNVTKMGLMFQGAVAFNQDISAWNVSSVYDMHNMFYGATLFNQNISCWDVSSVDSLPNMPDDFDTNSGFEGNTAIQPDWANPASGMRCIIKPTPTATKKPI
jgi:surface protein